MEDERIIELLKSDEGGLELARKKYSSLVMKICRGFLSSEFDAQEACADCFIRLWKTRREIDADKSSLKTYICMLARHSAIDRARKEKNRVTVPIEEDDLGLDVDYEDEAAKRINMKIIADCVRSMPSPAREVFIERYYYCRSVKEIAVRFGLKPKKVENILARDKKKLKAALLKGGIIL